MDATAIHTPILVARQIRKCLQADLGTYLTALDDEYFDGSTLPNVPTDAYWIGAVGTDIPMTGWQAPAIGIRYGDTSASDVAGDMIGSWGSWNALGDFGIVVTTAATGDPEHTIEVSQAYVSAIVQVLNANFLKSARSSSVTSSSLGKAIPATNLTPIEMVAGELADEDDGRPDIRFGVAVVRIGYKHK